MNDMIEEVKRGLRCCRKHGTLSGQDCNGHYERYTEDGQSIALVDEYRSKCPYGKVKTGCVVTLIDDALFVIESLQSENKILTENNIRIDEQRSEIAVRLEALQLENERLKAERRWIPVTERMPEEDEEVLVFDGAGCAVMALVNRDKTDVWHWDGSYYMEWQTFDGSLTADVNDITHWMPLSEPPKEGKQDEQSP